MSRSKRSSRTQRPREQSRLGLEALEPRVLLTGLTWYVDDTAAGANNGLSWADAFTDLQSALAAASGDQVWVAAGTYTPTSGTDRAATFQLASGVEVYGGFPDGGGAWGDRDWQAHTTTLSGDIGTGGDTADNSYHVVTSAWTDATAILDGFTITLGNANGTGTDEWGGGLHNEEGSPTLRNLAFVSSSATYGGGMLCDGGSPALANVTFTGNYASSSGGGLRVFSWSGPLTLQGVSFIENSTDGYGGGVYSTASLTVIGGDFIRNTAGVHGGGMVLYAPGELTNVRFLGNSALEGGGLIIYYPNGAVTVANALFVGNTATWGGGIYSEIDPGDAVNVVNAALVANNAGSSGGGFYAWSSGDAATLTNCTVWGNTASHDPQIDTWFSPTVTVAYSNVQGGYPGTANTAADPLFVSAPDPGADTIWGTADDDYGDLHVRPGSPVIDAGDNAAVPGGLTTDLAGDPRFVDDPGLADTGSGTAPVVDMGAYEAATSGEWDFGDANDPSWATLRASDGARHALGGTLFLGAGVDGDLDGQPDPDATGDDADGNDDEDGVTFVGILERGRMTDLTIVASEAGKLDAWVDFNGDGDWTDAGEQIFASESLAAGSNSLSFQVPWSVASVDPTYARFRVSTAGGLAPTGVADDGEVEDYYVAVTGGPTALYVDDTAAGLNNGSSWANAYTDLQAALAAAGDGDEIWVAAGTYKPTSGTGRAVSFELRNGVTLYGGFPDGGGAWGDRDWDTHIARLSGDLNGDDGPDWANRGDNSYHVVYTVGEDATAVLDGFTISGGNANGSDQSLYGGGIYSLSSGPTLRNLTVTDNRADSYGGGMMNWLTNGTVADCTFSANRGRLGGAMCLVGTPTITGCTFTGNSADQGGGVFIPISHPTLTDALFENNTAVLGGGIYADYAGVTVEGSSFVGNQASSGGGIAGLSSDVTLVDVRFVGNVATQGGGGLQIEASGVLSVVNGSFLGNRAGDGGGARVNHADAVDLTNIVFSGNAATSGGGALLVSSSPLTLTNSTLSANTASFGGGLKLNSATADVRNSILWGNTATSSGNQIRQDGGTLTVQHSDVQGGWAGANNISADPLFVDADGADNLVGTNDDDLRIRPVSPAINTGSNALLPPDVADLDGDLDTAEALPYDLDGNPRVVEATVDMGAYENQDPNHAPVLDASGDPALDGLTEDPAANDGILVSGLIARLGGTGITDPDAGALEGIAITGAEGVGGVWQFSTNGGTTWQGIFDASDASAVLLGDGANDRIRFNPYADWNGTSALTFRAWDQADGRASGTTGVNVSGNGGAAAYSAETETASIAVSPVEDSPTAGFGKALEFDPATYDAVSVANRAGIAFAANQDFTITMWVNHAGTGAQGLYYQARSNNGEFGYGLYIDDQNRLTQSVQSGGTGTQWSSTVIPPNEWTHVAWVKTGNNFLVYVNGELDFTGYTTCTGSAPTDGLWLGMVTGVALDGQMDEVGVWAKALGESEVQALLYRRPDLSHPAYGDLRAYWAFDDGSGTTAVDSAGGDNNGTLAGATTGPAWVDSTVRTWYGWENLPLDGQAIGSDPDGDALTFAKATDPANGAVVVNPDGSFTYTPAYNWTGDDSFTYTVDDGHGSPATGTTWVSIAPRFHIAATDPADGANVTLNGDLLLTVDFNHDVDPTTIGTDDLAVSVGTVTGAAASDADTVVYTISSLASEGLLTYDFAAGALADTGGLGLDHYGGSLAVDFDTVGYPTPLAGEPPLGSLIYDPSVNGSLFDGADTDTLTLVLDPGQTLTVVLEAGDPSLQAQLDVAGPGGPLGSGAAAGAGENVLINGVPVATPGIYSVTVSALAGSGAYELRVVLNADQELEDVVDPANSNDTLATAQGIDGSFLDLGEGMGRGAVLGTFDSDIASVTYSAAAVAYSFEDISATGTVTLEDEDDEYVALTAADLGGFQFPFYGVTYTSLYLSSNGLITFSYGDSDTGVYDLTDYPDQPAIAVFWDDLVVENDTLPYGVYWEVRGSGANERLIIQWHNVGFYGGPSGNPLVFQAVLYENGDIQLNYADLTGGDSGDEGAEAAVGIKDDGEQGPNRLLLAYEDGPNAYVGSGQSTLISRTLADVSADHYALTLEAGEPVTLALTRRGWVYDATVELLNASGSVLASGVTGPTNVGWVIDRYVPTTNGTYYARVAGVGTDYSLVAVTGGAFDQEPNNDLASAQDISGSVLPVLGSLTGGAAPMMAAESEPNDDGGPWEEDAMSAGDAAAANDLSGDFEDLGGGVWESTVTAYLDANREDFFSFRASGGDTVTIEVESYNGSGWDSYLELFDSTLTEVTWDDDGGTGAFSRIENETLSGPADQLFYVKVRGYDSTEDGEYLLRITLDAPQPAAPPESDFYSFTVGDGDELTLWTGLPGGGPGELVNNLDPYLRLYDPSGTLVVEDDNSADGVNALIQHTIGVGGAGVWTAEVSAAGAQTGEYVLYVDHVSTGPLEVARLADGQVILYDTDATSLLDADVSAADVRIWYDASGAVKKVRIVGNSTGFGMIVRPYGNRSVRIEDRRDVLPEALEALSFVATSGPASHVRLNSAVTGAPIGATLQTEGLVAAPDLDGDGVTSDPTAIYSNGPVRYLYNRFGISGDVVVHGADYKGRAINRFVEDGGDFTANVDFVTPDGGIGKYRHTGAQNSADLMINGPVQKFGFFPGVFDGRIRLTDARSMTFGGPVLGEVTFTADMTGRLYFAQGTAPGSSLNFGAGLAGGVYAMGIFGGPATVMGDFTGQLGYMGTLNGPATLFLSAGALLDGFVYRQPDGRIEVTGEDLGFGGAFVAIDVV